MLKSYCYAKLETEGKYWKLGANIDMGEFSQPMTSPLTDVSEGGNSFDGTFDGNGYVIYKLKINSDGEYASLFGRIGASGVVKNLGMQGYVAGARYVGGIAGECLGTILNCTFHGTVISLNSFTGGIVGLAGYGSSYSNCTVSGVITSNGSDTGGIAGIGYGRFENCTFEGTVSGLWYDAGGIVGGTNRLASISGCSVVNGTISGSNYVGGIAGTISSGVDHCTFSGSVSGMFSVGGIAGCSSKGGNKDNANIYECTVNGNIYGYRVVGGIIGASGAFNSSIKNCHFTGTVDGTSFGGYTRVEEFIEHKLGPVQQKPTGVIGGIAGKCDNNTPIIDCDVRNGSVVKGVCLVGGIVGETVESVSGCTNRSNVIGVGEESSYIGGIVGSGITVTGCVNYGNVNGEQELGGIAGENSGAITDCVNHGNINGTKINIGGIVGISYGMVNDCENYGNVATTNQVVGGIVGRALKGSISNCKNHGSVSGPTAAGIVSACYINNITNCLNDGTVSGTQMGWYVADSTLGLPVIMWANDGTQDNRIVLLKEGNLIAPGCPFTHENIEFTAWSTAADGSGSTFLPGDDFSGMPSNTSLYAYWMNTAAVYYIDGSTYMVDAGLLHSDLAFLPSGTYFTEGDLTLNNRLIMRGDVRLVLLNDTNVVAPKGIGVPQGSSLTICKGYIGAQSGVTGTLTATGDSGGAGIGGNYKETNGTIIINDGIITATGDGAAAGIGGGNSAWGGTVIINGGTVTAYGTAGTTAGEGAAGIGGGHGGSGGTVTINGGEVTATGSIYAAGIGGGRDGSGGTVTINNGTVIATGNEGGAGIGGDNGSGGNVTVNGGTVIAAGNGGAAGIGGGNNGTGGEVTVNGGEVTATGSTAAAGQAGAGIGAGAYSGPGDNQNGRKFTMTDGKVVATAGAGDQYYSLHANAIGANLQRSPGTIDIGQYLDAWTYDRWGATVHGNYDGRADICHESFVTIERCRNHQYDNGVCSRCHAPVDLSVHFEGAGTESDPYLIYRKFDWDTLCELNNEGRVLFDSGVWFRLESDIAVDYMLGTDEHHFKSNFDGGGHTLTFNRGNPDDDTVIAPFACTDGSTIRNLRTAGSVTGTYKRASGLIGENYAHSTLENCRVSMSLSGNRYVAAFCVGDGSGLTIDGCVFDGILSAGDRSGGFVGWTNGSLLISNSLFAPDSVSSSTNCYTFYYKGGSGTPTLTNSYWQKTFGTAQGTKALSVTGDNDVTIDFGTPGKTYNVSGITAYTHGIIYKDVFYAGQDEEVNLANLSAVAWDNFCINSYTVIAGTLTAAANGYKLTMPSEDTVIKAVQSPMFATSPTVHLTADGGTDGYGNQDPDKLFDGLTDNNSKWCCAFYGNNYVEFHSDVPVVPTAYSMTTAADTSPNYLSRNPYYWELLGKMNASDEDWISIIPEEKNDRLPAENCVEIFFPLDNSAAYQCYKLEVTAVRWGGKLQIGEFKLVGTPSFGTATFTLPTGLRTIEESAFEDMTAMISVDAGSVTSVGANAFKDCSALNRIRLSKNCTIAPDAFAGCGTVYIFAPAGGSTEAYCNAHENCVFVGE